MPLISAHLKKHRIATDKSSQVTPDEAYREVNVAPRRSLAFGRRLSFSIDDSSVQMAAVSHLGRKKKIRHVSKVYIPGELAGTPARTDFIAHAVDEFISAFGGYGAQVAVTVSGKETVLRTFPTPLLKRKQLESAIRFEAKKQLPFPPEDCVYDYRPVSKVVASGRTQLKIALHAATRRLVEEHLEPLRQRKVVVSRVYHSQDVLGQLLRYLPDFNDDKQYALLNIDREHCEISFYRGSFLEFFHVGAAGSSFLGKQTDQSGLEGFAQLLAVEIQTSLDYYSGQYPRAVPDKVFVHGDLSYSTELLELLNGYSGFEFARFPVETLAFIPRESCPFTETLPVCLSALASSVCDVKLANFLPEQDRLKHLKRSTHTAAQICLAVLAVALAGGLATMKAKAIVADDNLITLNRQIESFKNSAAYQTYSQLKWQIASDRAFLEEIKESPSYLNLDLKELSLLTPSSVRLLHLAYRSDDPDRNLTLQGIVASKDIPPEILLAEYVETLNASPFFENVSLMKHVKRKLGDGFEIEFHIDLRGIV